MDKFVTTDIFMLSLICPAFFVLLGIYHIATNNEITRLGVFLWGVGLIALAGIIAWELITWRPIAALLVNNVDAEKAISQASFDEFERTTSLLLWFIPFVTGALGTNLISDALTKPLRYERPSSQAYIVRATWWILKNGLWFVFWIVVGIFMAVRLSLTFYTWPRKLRAHAQVSRAAYLAKYAVAKQPWER